jgi:hypothetical protein
MSADPDAMRRPDARLIVERLLLDRRPMGTQE